MPKKTPTADNSWMYHRIHRASATTRLYPLRPRSGCRCCRSRRSPGWQESRLRFLAGLATNKQWIGLLGEIFTEISMDFPMKIMGFSGFNFPVKRRENQSIETNINNMNSVGSYHLYRHLIPSWPRNCGQRLGVPPQLELWGMHIFIAKWKIANVQKGYVKWFQQS